MQKRRKPYHFDGITFVWVDIYASSPKIIFFDYPALSKLFRTNLHNFLKALEMHAKQETLLFLRNIFAWIDIREFFEM